MMPQVAIAATAILTSTAAAQTGLGSAAVYDCHAVQSCDDTGACIDGIHQMFVIESFLTGTEPGPTYFAGPLQRAGAGIFFEQQVLTMQGVSVLEEVLERFPAIMGMPLFVIDRASEESNRYFVIRESRYFTELHGARTVTEFLCEQELHQ